MFYYIVTYGCQMNVHESEKIAGILHKDGHTACDTAEEADLIVFNTCCIRDNAEKRALGNIGALKQRKITQKNLIIAVLGCMTQQKGFAASMKEKYPYVDIILGANNLHLLPYYLKLNDRKNSLKIEDTDTYDINIPVDTFRTSYPNAWVNIMYGCNNFCSYCIVPYVRGREISRPPREIINEIKFLLDEGYKEITLLGQNVNSYLCEGYNFARLLSDISKIDKKFRLRFMTSHPKDFNKEIIDIIKSSENICNHIHLPVQSGSDRILKLMNRKYTSAHYIKLADAVYENIGGALISTDLMVGFPTETDGDFEDTLSLVKRCRFSQAFTFVYSPRSGTLSASMPDIDKETKKHRITELIKRQNAITKEISDTFRDKTAEILIENESDGIFTGRTTNGKLVSFKKSGSYKTGDFATVLISVSKSASLTGTILLDANLANK
ncbi:MAG: tRNA (N6-isopentenyl adenosine(37)-C2)-methylthiotransferase MiaB [Clostridiales bacterium]|jgi:tRNA-2-methylthio-N6-dimethylallyladenosine synthase|nr:tRNA (N6-isopentenyl adenosine(37)-C2)-methylthiotransferase MiaB [Clostridiales bacterium]